MREVFKPVVTAAQAEILGERTGRHKRNALLISVAIVALHIMPDVKFSGFPAVGIEVGSSGESYKYIPLIGLWVAFLYQNIEFGMFAWRDWKHWLINLTDHWDPEKRKSFKFFPELRMYASKTPSQETTKRALENDIDIFRGWNPVKTNWQLDENHYTCEIEDHNGAKRTITFFEMPTKVIEMVRRQVRWFVFLELGPPIAALVIAVGAFFWDLAG